MERERDHDGIGWRLHIATATDTLHFTIEHEHEHDWLPTQQWSEPTPATTRQRRAAITDSARAHGWITPSDRWPHFRKDGTLILEDMFPFDWERIVKDATALRAHALTYAARVDRAWRLAITDANTTGGLKVQELADVSGRGRHAIYRMRTDDLGADDTVLLTEIRNA